MSCLKEATATSGGWRGLAEAVIGVQEVPEFIMTSAEASRRVNGTEATHWPISALDPSMILLNAVVIRHNFRDATGSMTLRAVGCILG